MKKILFKKVFQLASMKDEFRLWIQIIKPVLATQTDNFISICEYGVTEMVNNIIDHSEANEFELEISELNKIITIILRDNGIGIFQKIRKKLNLDSELHALIELMKGKLTTAPEGHTGEGIFFTSRCFDRFVLSAGEICAEFSGETCHVQFMQNAQRGTYLEMSLDINTVRATKSIFDQFCGNDEYVFAKTRFALSIAQYEGTLVSRSQAKRIASRLEQFVDVEINFADINTIGQGFADELFRVWQNQHPETRLHAININADVKKMLSHVGAKI